ncbi:MAG: hypothetical protein WCC94_11830 [Candidatus Bathyarchaeia archaeon]
MKSTLAGILAGLGVFVLASVLLTNYLAWLIPHPQGMPLDWLASATGMTSIALTATLFAAVFGMAVGVFAFIKTR